MNIKLNKTKLSLTTTAQAMTGGKDAVQGVGEDVLFTFGAAYNTLSYNPGDLLTFVFTDAATGYQTQIGAGYVTGLAMNYCTTLSNKVYALNNGSVYCCAVGQPTIWNDPNALGNGYVTLSNWYAATENLVAMAPFQGKLAFFSRSCTQVWNINDDVAQWSLSQVLQNVGTIAAQSVQGIGELDVLFLQDSGIRSLRVRYADLNATSNDVGSAIDALVQAQLLTLTDAQRATSCSIVEPSQNRYWCFIPNAVGTGGYIWVLSYFPSNKIIAWSRYTTVDSAGAAFVPSKFVIYAGQVYAYDAVHNTYLLFGGANGNTYDATVATMQLPFYDEKKPGHKKHAKFLNVDVAKVTNGAWTVKGSPDWLGNSFKTVGSAGQATFDNGIVGYEDVGTHFSFEFQSTGSTAAIVSSVVFHYEMAEEQ